jgi:hypothetical protein
MKARLITLTVSLVALAVTLAPFAEAGSKVP